MSRRAATVGSGPRDPACDRRANTHRCVPRGRRDSVARTSLRRPLSARSRPETGALPPPGSGRSRRCGPVAAGVVLVRASRDPYRVISPEEYLRGDGWETAAPGEGIGATEDWDRPTADLRSAGSGCQHRRIRPWLLAAAGGLGFTGGLLAVFLQLRGATGARPPASPPQRADGTASALRGERVLRVPRSPIPPRPARPARPANRSRLPGRTGSRGALDPGPRSTAPRMAPAALAAARHDRPPATAAIAVPVRGEAPTAEFGFER